MPLGRTLQEFEEEIRKSLTPKEREEYDRLVGEEMAKIEKEITGSKVPLDTALPDVLE